MKIDNSMATLFWKCPLAFKERYVNNLEPRSRKTDALDFGTRVHQLLEIRHKAMKGETVEFPPLPDPILEAEAQSTFAAYEAHYPTEPWDVVDVERYFEVELPRGECLTCKEPLSKGMFGETICFSCMTEYEDHIYCGEMDGVVRMRDSGRLWLLETKTEKRGGKGNLPLQWQNRSQVGLYIWAAEQLYGEQFEGISLNVITRQSPAGQIGPTFRRDSLHRSKAQVRNAVENIVWVADAITECEQTGFWPSNRNECVSQWGWQCDYLFLHQTETRPSDELIQIKYQEPQPYLSGL